MKFADVSFARRSPFGILLSFALWVAASISCQGQVYVQGQPTVGSPPPSQAASSQSFLDATEFRSSPSDFTKCGTLIPPLTDDAAGKIQAAICALPPNGGTVDGRGFGDPNAYTSVKFGSNPFADPSLASDGTRATTKNVVVLLPARVIEVDAVIGIPRHSLLKGQGSLTTILQIGATFPGYGSNTEVTNNCGPYVSGTGGRAASR